MGFWKSTGLGLGALAAYFGRGPLAATYSRGIQYGTDIYLRAWGAVLIAFAVIVLNAFLMWMESRGAQTVLLLFSLVIGVFYLFTPKIAIPLMGVAASVRAGEEGDQANVWLLRDGLKDLVNNAGVVFFWIGIYILTTMVVPFGMYFVFFLVLHVPLVLIIPLLMSGNVRVNPETYEIAWKALIVTVICGVLAVMVFRENLGPWWVKHTANQASRVEASQQSDAIRQIDDMHAKWLKKHVRLENGQRVITVEDAETKKPKTVDAAPYIAQKQKERDEALKALAPNSVVDDAASAKSAGDETGSKAQKDGGAKKLPSWIPASVGEWGGVQWMLATLGFGVTLFLLHLLLLPPFLLLLKAFGITIKKDSDEKVVTKKVVTSSSSSGVGGGTLLLLLLLAFAGYMLWDHPTVMKWMGRDGSGVYTKTVILPSMTELNVDKFSAHFKHTNAQVPLSQDLWHGKEVDITKNASITKEKGVNLMVAFGEGNYSLDLYLNGGACAPVSNLVPYTCEGTWKTERNSSPIQGYFRGSWNTQGTNFLVSMYLEDHRVASGSGNVIATVLFVNKEKDGK